MENKRISLFVGLIIVLSTVACSGDKKHKKVSEKTKKEIQDLKLRLDAAEAQLLNLQTELSRYRNDSLPQPKQ